MAPCLWRSWYAAHATSKSRSSVMVIPFHTLGTGLFAAAPTKVVEIAPAADLMLD